MSITDKKGINVTSGFKLISGQPIDARFIVEDETELQTIVTNGAVYEGLHVWVKSLGKEKVWNGTKFVESQTSGSGTVSYESEITSGTKIGTLTINGIEYQVLIPNIGSGGGSNVSYTSKLTEGINIGTLTIDGNTYELYAPETNNNASVDLSKLDLYIQEDKLNIVNNGVTVGNGVEVERLNKNIVEIETLPEHKLVGNVIPSEGLIEKIYFNQNLSVEKMLEIFRSLDYVNDFTGTSSKCYYITATSLSLTGNTVFYIQLVDGSEDNGYNFILLPPEGNPFLLYHLDVNEMVGEWALNIPYYEANVNVITSTLAGYIGQTMQNEKLTDLLSLGEFNKDYSEVADKNTIYKVLEDDRYKIFNGTGFENLEVENIIFKQTVNSNNFDEIKPFSQAEFDKIRNNLNTKVVVFSNKLSSDTTMVFTVSGVDYSSDNLISILYFSCVPRRGDIAKFYLSDYRINNNSKIPIEIFYFPERDTNTYTKEIKVIDDNGISKLSLVRNDYVEIGIPLSELNQAQILNLGLLTSKNYQGNITYTIQYTPTFEQIKNLFSNNNPLLSIRTKQIINSEEGYNEDNNRICFKIDDTVYIQHSDFTTYRTLSFAFQNDYSATNVKGDFCIIDIKCQVRSYIDLEPISLGEISFRPLSTPTTFYTRSTDVNYNIDYSDGTLGEKYTDFLYTTNNIKQYEKSILNMDTLSCFIKMPNATTYNTEVILVPNSINRSIPCVCYNDVNIFYEDKFYKLNKIRIFKIQGSTHYFIKCNLEIVE